jgi:hypothetical protein
MEFIKKNGVDEFPYKSDSSAQPWVDQRFYPWLKLLKYEQVGLTGALSPYNV